MKENKIKTIIIDDRPKEIELIKHYLEKIDDVEIIATSNDPEEAFLLLCEHFFTVDLVITDMTLDPAGKLDEDLSNAPKLLEKVRIAQGFKPGSFPFGIIYITQHIQIWAVNFAFKYQPPATLLRFVAKGTVDDQGLSTSGQLAEGIERFRRKFFETPYYDQKTRTVVNKWCFKDAYLEQYLEQRIPLAGSFVKGEEAEEESKTIHPKRRQIEYLIKQEKSCRLKITGEEHLFETDDPFPEINAHYLWWRDNEDHGEDPIGFQGYISAQFIKVHRKNFVNIDFVNEHEKSSKDNPSDPKGGFLRMKDKSLIEVSTRENKALIEKLISLRSKAQDQWFDFE